MKQMLFSRFSGPLVGLGILVAVACLAGGWYINRLQADLAHAVRQDASALEADGNLQVQLRHLRVHSLVFAADNAKPRWDVVQEDLAQVSKALEAVKQTALLPEDARLAERIVQDYARYKDDLQLDALYSSSKPAGDVAKWSDAHHMSDLLVPCRELADRQRERMKERLERSETQTAWAGWVLFYLGLAGVLGGLLCGYVTARTLTIRATRLSIRVQAVQSRLNQEVGAMTLQGPPHTGDLDEQLDQVVERVSAVCRKLQEQERDLLRAEQLATVGQLAAGVAHEVRNPLTGVKFLLQAAVRDHNAMPLTADRLHLMLQEVARIERTVQGLMDFAQGPPLDRRPHDIRSVLQAAVNVAQSRAELKSVAIRLVSPSQSLSAAIDRDRFLSLLTNLLFNAIDATPAGGSVELSTAAEGDTIHVLVNDSGAGIDETVSEKLFTPFATTKPSGTGLGLTVARRVAREHGGELTAANRPEGGASFTLTLPALERSNA